MFTGLVEGVGTIEEIEPAGDGRRLVLDAGHLAADLAPGASLAVNGCCQTVLEVRDGRVSMIAVPETLRVTTLGSLVEGDLVNLERPVRLMDRMGGHMVQGHVDGVGLVREVKEEPPGWRIRIACPPALLRYVASKGSIAVDGTSLTVAAVDDEAFEVAIVPHTWQATVCHLYHTGTEVNLEVDLLARYLEKLTKEEA